MRGSGKTATLLQLRNRARELGMVACYVQARKDESLAAALSDVIRETLKTLPIAPDAQNKWLTTFQFGIPNLASVSVERKANGRSSTEGPTILQLARRMTELAISLDVAFVLCVDELQNARNDDLSSLSTALQLLVESEELPLHFRGAALPPFRYAQLGSKAQSFLKRSTKHPLEPLTESEAHYGLKLYSRAGGGSFTSEALRLAASEVRGSPYRMQLIGHHSWSNSLAPHGKIEVSDVRLALETTNAIYDADVALLTFDEFSETETVALQLAHAAPDQLTKKRLAGYVAEARDIKHWSAASVIAKLIEAKVFAINSDNRLSISEASGLTPTLLNDMFDTEDEDDDEWMPRSKAHCVLAKGHQGPHRSR